MNHLPSSLPAALLNAADLAMQQRRWGDAVLIFDQIPQLDNGASIKRCLCRNLASLQKHRPDIYQLLISLPSSNHCGIGASATGHPTIVCRAPDGRNLALSPANRPLDALASALKLLAPVHASGQAFALCGIGDGYLLHEVAEKPPKLYLDTQQPVFLLEPDPHIVLTAMMIHDYSGETGAIEQPRIQWFVGSDWAERLRKTLFEDQCLPCPAISLTLGFTAVEMQKTVAGIMSDLARLNEELRQQVETYYANRDPSAIAELFGENPSRRPRVFFITTRFSTVLQFATQDTAAGFRQAGWDTEILIEPSRYHRSLTIATRSRLIEIKPDLIFQIDHLRHEHAGMFPENLPFVCWIQDHLSHLMTAQAGAQVGPNDFVLTDSGPLYSSNYNYPARQIIGTAKLTTAPALLPAPARPVHDLVFISNASTSPQVLRDNLLKKLKGGPREHEFVARCVDRVVKLHAAGENLATYRDMHDFLSAMLTEADIRFPEEQFLALLRELCHPIGDCLYRQQTLAWIADVAKESGLSLALYGNGWDKHPRLGEYARGTIAPGKACEAIVRNSAINFQIAPYLCLHQRVLDGICVGGFFLVREHISDVVPQALLDLLEENCPPGVSTVNEARACIPPPVRDQFERLIKDCNNCLTWSGTEDSLSVVRAFAEAQLLVPGAGVLPRLNEISFTDKQSLRQCILRFAHDAELRDSIVAEQRQSVVARLTYGATMQRVVRRIGQLLAERASERKMAPVLVRELGKAA